MKKILMVGVGLAVALFAIFGLVSCTQGGTGSGTLVEGVVLSQQQEGINVSGEGKVTVTPNLATLSVGVEAQADTVAAAQAQAADAMNLVVAALKDNGLADKDIQTQYFSIYPVTRWDETSQQEVLIGYRVSNSVSVEIRDMEKVGSIIDAVAVAGGDLTRINGISFSVEDPSQYYADARTQAVADAKEKATQLADLADVTLGKPFSISESTGTPPVIYRDLSYAKEAAMAVPAPTPISPGEVDVTLSVQISYSILN